VIDLCVQSQEADDYWCSSNNPHKTKYEVEAPLLSHQSHGGYKLETKPKYSFFIDTFDFQNSTLFCVKWILF